MNRIICVYGASSDKIEDKYFQAAEELGRRIAQKKDGLIFGAGMIGLMGAVAREVHRYQGKVIGVIPEALNLKGIVYETCDELLVTKTMRERKAIMDERANAFVALPGGYGTLEELLEIITLKQLRYHNKPIVILNTGRFYDKLIEQFEKCIGEKFAVVENRELYFVTDKPSEVIDYIDNYKVVDRNVKYSGEEK